MSDGGIQDTPTQFAARDTAALSKGVVIDERYEILSFVGSGGMCSVYRARHLQLDKTVAIKVLAAPVSSNPDAAKRFQREAQAVSALKHKNIVEAYGFGTFDDHCYMAIEFLEGESLADRLRREGTLDRESFVRIVSQICEGMDFAHSKGIVHRDLKPSNIMIVDDDQVKVVDFGIAKIDTANGDWQKLTQTGKILGTLLYISPEQCQGMGADARSDIYSLGCLMYELLEGSPPFSAESQFALIYQHMEALPEGKQLGEFEGVIHACLQKNPNDRPQSMRAIVQALAHPVNFTAPKLKQSRQFPVSKPVLVLTGIFVVAVFAFVYFYISLKSSGLVTRTLSKNTRRLLQKLPRDEAVIAPARLEEADAEMAPFSDDELNEALSDYPPKLNGLAYALLHSDKLARSEYWFERIEHYLKNTNRSRPELMLMVEYGLASSKGPAQSIEAINVIEQAMPGKAADFVNPQLRSEFLRLYVQRIDRATAQCEGDEQKIEGVRTRALKFFQRYHDDPALASASARCLRETRLILPPQPVRNLLHDLNWGKGTVTVSETSIRAVENALPRISRMKLDPAELVGLHTALADRFSRGLNRDKAIYYNDLALKELHAPETDLSNDLRANYYLIAQTYNRVKKQHQADAICRELLSRAGAPNTVGYAARLSEWGTVKEAGYERGDSPPSDKYLEAAAIADAAKDVDPLGIEPAMYRAYAMDSLSALEHNPKKASEIAKTLSAKVETWSKGSQSAGRKEALMGRVTNGLQKYYSRIGEKDKARHIGELEHKLVRAVYWYQE